MIEATVDPASVSQPEFGMIVEKDIDVPMRDRLSLKSDIFRPDDDGRFPVIMTLGPYPKGDHIDYGDRAEESGPYMHWESANPEWWVPRGYVQIRVDARGSGASPGYCDILSRQETEDYYDCIEWAAVQPWCNGNVGLMGISYFAVNQWNVAATQPPHLRAMIPWEGWGDLYRDAAYHGGIFSDGFFGTWYWPRVVERTLGENPENWQQQFLPFYDIIQEIGLDDDFYRERSVDWDRVQTPFLSAGNWGNRELHLRGNTEGYFRAAAVDKRLRIHTGTHIAPFYRLEGRLDQMRYFDYWLKGIDNGLDQDPPVKLAIRTSADEEQWRFENEWPLARTRWTKLYLGGRDGGREDGRLADRAAPDSASLTYSAAGPRGVEFRGASFHTEAMAGDLEITGPVSLVLWVSSSTEDMDIFVSLHNIDPGGREISFPNGMHEPAPVSKGWQRLSHRKLDAELSEPWRPYHAHDEVQPLSPGEVVKAEVEILPMSNILKKGHRLRLDIQPWDDSDQTRYSHDNSARWRGENKVYFGGPTASYLLLPFIP